MPKIGKRSKGTRKRGGATVGDLSVTKGKGAGAKGGANSSSSWFVAIAQAMGKAADKAAQ